jgi:hypothetical protein
VLDWYIRSWWCCAEESHAIDAAHHSMTMSHDAFQQQQQQQQQHKHRPFTPSTSKECFIFKKWNKVLEELYSTMSTTLPSW